MTPKDLSRIIRRLKPHLPVSTKFEMEMYGGVAAQSRAWYSSQQEHWLGWLKGYSGPGYYGRKTWRGRDAEFVYNHIVNPQMLMWLAEAAGAPKTRLQRARKAALAAGKTMQAMSGAIRREFPFAEIEALLNASVRRGKRA